MQNYLNALQDIKDKGTYTDNRTGVGTISMFGDINLKFNLMSGNVPVVTTKRIHLHSIIHELLWMLSGDSNIKYLTDNNVHIWDEWADASGDLGPVYGRQWRAWNDTRVLDSSCDLDSYKDKGFNVTDYTTSNSPVVNRTIDQIVQIEEMLSSNSKSRRIILTAWNVSHIDSMKLPPCHTLAQFMVIPMTHEERIAHAKYEYPNTFVNKSDTVTREVLDTLHIPNNKLSCKLYQRSADFFLGVPFNITFYALLTHMLAKSHNLAAGDFFHTFGDAHIYINHINQVNEQLNRETLSNPTVCIPKRDSVLDYTYKDIVVRDYVHHDAIKAPVAV